MESGILSNKFLDTDLFLNNKGLTLLLENLHQGVLLEDADRKIVFVNRFFRKMFMIPNDFDPAGLDSTLFARQIAGLFSDSEGFLACTVECIDSRVSITGQELQLADGHFIERDYLPVRTNDHSTENFWFYRDITGRRLAEKKNNSLSEQNILMAELGFRLVGSSKSEEIYRLLLKQLCQVFPDILLVGVKYHDDGKYAQVFDYKLPSNSVFSKSFCLVKKDLKKRVFERLPSPEQLKNPQTFKKINTGISGLLGPYFPGDLVGQAVELSGPHEVFTIGLAVKDVHFGNVFFIIPELNRELNHSLIEAIVYQCSMAISNLDAYEKLAAAMKKAEESNRLKSAFLANMSHEIRTPMNGIVGFGQILKMPGLDSDKVNKYIDVINSNASYLLGLINDIMDFSKIEAGGIDINSEEVNVEHIFDELYKMFHLQKPGVELKLAIESVPLIITDRLKLTQVLCNLMGNAIKFTTEGCVKCSVKIRHGMIRFCVEDTGSGIKDKDKANIFDRFFQGEHKTWMSCSGTGLGLAIARAYIEMMKGRIWFDSEWGLGSRFYFTIPFLPLK
jgi:signal transduction histidine kinase